MGVGVGVGIERWAREDGRAGVWPLDAGRRRDFGHWTLDIRWALWSGLV